MATKRVTHSADFLAAAATDLEGALAYMLMAAFGISLAELTEIAESLIVTNNTAIISLALASAVQIRGNVVFVGDTYAGIKDTYPALVIEGQRAQDDTFNFSALHCLGHVLAHWSNHPLGQKILKKAGSCITGQDTTKNAAGEINQEISRSWAPEDIMKFQSVLMTQKHAPALKGIIDALTAKAVAFRTKVKPMGGAGAMAAGATFGASGAGSLALPPPPSSKSKGT